MLQPAAARRPKTAVRRAGGKIFRGFILLRALFSREQRVRIALEEIREALHRVGGFVELLERADEFVAEPAVRRDEFARRRRRIVERAERELRLRERLGEL